jgi:GxxExxY protein
MNSLLFCQLLLRLSRTMSHDHVLHRELSYQIVGILMDVHNKLGPGWDEHAYHQAVVAGLRSKGILAEAKLGGKLYHREILADVFELDILVEQRVILELKHLDGMFSEAHFVQIINYLKLWRKNLGILVDFGQESLRYKRVPYTPVDGVIEFKGPWDVLFRENPTARPVADMFDFVLQTHGLGYGVECNRKLFRVECRFQGLRCEQPDTQLAYQGRDLGVRHVKSFFVERQLLVLIAAHPQTTTAKDLARLRSYARQLGTATGVLANFGKKVLTLRALLVQEPHRATNL